MRRLHPILATAALVAAMLVAGAACGGSDEPEDDASPTAAATTAATTATAAPEATEEPSADRSALDSVFPILFSGALGGATGDPFAVGVGEGDEALKDLLLKQGDVPAGYQVVEEMVMRVPDGISVDGGADFALSMAVRGDLESENPTDVAMLMSMAGRFDDLQDLEAMFGEMAAVSEQDVLDAMGIAGQMPGFELVDIAILDTSSLGEGTYGLAMTLDMSGFFEAFGEIPEDQRETAEAFSAITMRMYMFGRGDLMGGVMRIGFGDALDDGVDELSLAQIVLSKLEAAR